MTIEKKKTVILTCVLALIAAVLIGFLVVEKLKENGTISNSEAKQIMKDFNKYYNSNDRVVIYYASTTCGWCSLQTPILETIAKDYDMDYLYVDTSKLSKNQKDEVAKKLGIEATTPNTVIVENSKVVDVANGFTPASEYVKFFASNGLIPEDAVYSKEKSLTALNYDEYEKLINSAGAHVIVISQTTCSHCIAVKPALNSIAEEYELPINYIDVNVLGEEEYNKFHESLSKLDYDDPAFVEKGSFGTPLTLIVKNGKISSYISGERSKSQFIREFKKAGLISE